MNPLVRWVRFNLVGALGMTVQLAALAVFNRLMAGHYLYASAAAIELTLLHNFVWHMLYTWRDRRGNSTPLRLFVRFHLSNGLVSMLGNLALMRLLVHETHLPLLLSNAVAVLCCSIANFCLGNNWVFAKAPKARPSSRPNPPPAISRCSAFFTLCSAFFTLLLFVVASAVANAQTRPDSASPASPAPEYGTDCAYENVFAGPAAANGSAGNATFTAGVTFGQYSAKPLGKGLAGSPQFELGIVGVLPHGHPLDGLASVYYTFANKLPNGNAYPFLTGGYTRFFATGNAANFGLGFDFGRKDSTTILRVELRDYYLFTGPRQHVIGLRIGVGKLIAD